MPIKVEYEPGTVEIVEQHDGSTLALRKLAADYDVHDRTAAMGFLQQHAAKGQIVTGLLYVEPEAGRPARASAHRRRRRSIRFTRRTSAPARRRSTRSTPVCDKPSPVTPVSRAAEPGRKPCNFVNSAAPASKSRR